MRMAVGSECFGAARSLVCLHKPLAAPCFLAGGTGRLKPPVAPGTPIFKCHGRQACFSESPLYEALRHTTVTRYISSLFSCAWQSEVSVSARPSRPCVCISRRPRPGFLAGGTGRLKPLVAPGTPIFKGHGRQACFSGSSLYEALLYTAFIRYICSLFHAQRRDWTGAI